MPDTHAGGWTTTANSHEISRELILRQQFLVLALDRADEIVDSVSQKDGLALVQDLNQCIDFLRSISEGLSLPAFAHITNRNASDWEKELFVAFSTETPRWDRVLRLNHELDQILDLLEKLATARPGFEDEIEAYHVVFQAHKNLQASVLRNWIVAEQARGRPIDKVIAIAEGDWASAWQDVIESLGFAERVEPDRLPKQKTLNSVMKRILHPFAHKPVERVA